MNWVKIGEYQFEICCEASENRLITVLAQEFYLHTSGKVKSAEYDNEFHYCPFCGVKFNIRKYEYPPYT